MHYILQGSKPKKKMSGTVSLEGEYSAKYVATSSREHIMGYCGKDVIASIYVSAGVIKELDVAVDKIQVAGDYERFLPIIGVGVAEGAERPKIIWDGTAKGNSNKVKDMEYHDYVDMSQQKDAIKGGIEEFLYKNVNIQKLQEEHDLSWAENKNYRILTEDDEIYEWVEGLAKTDEIVGFDTETSGLRTNRTKRDVLVGICMSYEDHAGVYLPINQLRYDNVKMGEKKLVELLKPFCHRHSKERKKLVTHNGQFDWRVMKMFGWDLNITYDTLIRQGIKAISTAKNARKLKEIARLVLGLDVVELEDMYEKRTDAEIRLVRDAVMAGAAVNDITRFKLETLGKDKYQKDLMDFRFASYEFSKLYGSADADFPRLIHKIMDKDWNHDLDFIYNLEVALIPVLGEQEYYGVRAVKPEFERLYEEAQREVIDLEKKAYGIVGREFKVTSGVEKGKILFEEMGVPLKPRYKTKKGGYKTDKDVMADIAQFKNNDGSPRYPLVPVLQRHSKVSTLISNFYSKLPRLIVDDYLFPQYNSINAETGRLSCNNPNIQQTEPQSRLYMVPDSDDYYFLICDYSQVEYRLMAGLSHEKKVVDFFKANPEADYHILAYANMMGKKYEDVTSAERKTGKVLNFGTSYGLEDANLALKLYGNDTPYHQQLAREARKKYFDGVPDLRDYFEDVRDEAEREGYTKTLFGRIREIPEFKTKGHIPEYKRGSGRRKAGNMPVQGTAADIMKMGMIRIRKYFRKYGFKEDRVRFILNVHDEVCMQVHKSINPWLATAIMREAMEIDLSKYGIPPLYVGANVGYCWKDGKVDELEAPVLLMDRKCKWAMEKFKAGEELPTYDDPRQHWADEISKFALEVIQEEIKKDGIKTLEQAYVNGRLVKYSHHFGGINDALIMECMVRPYKAVFNDLEAVSHYKSKLATKLLDKVETRLKGLLNGLEGEARMDKAFSDYKVVTLMKYFGAYGGNVLKWFVELDFDRDALYERMDGRKSLGKGDLIRLPDLKKKTVEKVGEEIEEDYVSIEDQVRSMLKYDKGRNHFTLLLDKNDYELMSLVDAMLVPSVNRNLFKKTTRFTTFELVFEDGSSARRGGMLWIAQFLPLLKELLVVHLTTGDYKGFDEKIERVGSSFVAMEDEIVEERTDSTILGVSEILDASKRSRAVREHHKKRGGSNV
ncbi:MAG: DNA polymerase [Bacillus sp. (in: firmicutes)]